MNFANHVKVVWVLTAPKRHKFDHWIISHLRLRGIIDSTINSRMGMWMFFSYSLCKVAKIFSFDF